MFGDTFSGNRVGEGRWRSPVVLIGTGDRPHQPITWERAGGPNPDVAEQRDGESRLPRGHLDRDLAIRRQRDVLAAHGREGEVPGGPAQLYGRYVLPGSRLDVAGGVGVVDSQWKTDDGWPYRATLRDTRGAGRSPADPINL